MRSLTIQNEVYPAVAACKLNIGMIYWDGSEISNVQTFGKTTMFTLSSKNLTVYRKVRSSSLIALSHDQVCEFI